MSIFTPVFSKPIPAPAPGFRQIFTDGGLAGSHPSAFGASWAWCEVDSVDRSRMLNHDSGKLLRGMETSNGHVVTSNAGELCAILSAIEFVVQTSPDPNEGMGADPFKLPPVGTRVQLHTDSVCAAKWALGSGPTDSIPVYLAVRVAVIRSLIRLGLLNVQLSLMGGHPNPDDLVRGWRVQKGKSELPVSKWNVWCDEECTRLADEMQGKTKRKPGPHGAKKSKTGIAFLPKQKPVAVQSEIVETGPLFAYAPRAIDVPALARASAKAVQMDMFASGEGAIS